jgi:hypothetical protein
MKSLDAANDNDMGRQIARAHQIWQPRLGHDLTDEESRRIIHNVTSFFGILAEWSRAEKLAAANDSATSASNDGKVPHDR